MREEIQGGRQVCGHRRAGDVRGAGIPGRGGWTAPGLPGAPAMEGFGAEML